MIYVSRKEHFNAAHKLYNPKWSPEKNEEVFGPCANANWHGHNFELIVTVKGKPDPDTGFVIDLKKLGDLIKSEIIEQVDHKNLNLDVPFMKGKMASCEILITEFWHILYDKISFIAPSATLHSLKLFETRKNFVEYFGE
ncbi:MAG: 6-carboxytetrahydropterin synthase [Cyclobacteriaceae bacterium]